MARLTSEEQSKMRVRQLVQEIMSPENALMFLPMGGVVRPGMVASRALAARLARLMRARGLSPSQAIDAAVEAATAGRITPDEMKMFYDAVMEAEKKLAPRVGMIFREVSGPVEGAVSEAVKKTGLSAERIAEALSKKFKVTKLK